MARSIVIFHLIGCIVPIALAGPLCPPEALNFTALPTPSNNGSGLQSANSTVAQSLQLAKSMAENVTNYEVYFDTDWQAYLTRFKAGMGPGSVWYEANVMPFDSFFSNMTTNATNQDAFAAMDDAMEDYVTNEDSKKKKHNKPPPHKGQLRFKLERLKNNIHYSNVEPVFVIGQANKLCKGGCPTGRTWKKDNLQYVAPAAGGTGPVQGDLIAKFNGNWASKPGQDLGSHFVNALQYTAAKTSKITNAKWKTCQPGACGGSGGCGSGTLKNQHKGPHAIAISRYVFGFNQWLGAGQLYVKVTMKELDNTDCASLMSVLQMAIGEVPNAPGFTAAATGYLEGLYCNSAI